MTIAAQDGVVYFIFAFVSFKNLITNTCSQVGKFISELNHDLNWRWPPAISWVTISKKRVYWMQFTLSRCYLCSYPSLDIQLDRLSILLTWQRDYQGHVMIYDANQPCVMHIWFFVKININLTYLVMLKEYCSTEIFLRKKKVMMKHTITPYIEAPIIIIV